VIVDEYLTVAAATAIGSRRKVTLCLPNDKNARKSKVLTAEKDEEYTPITAASGVEQAFKLLEGRWKLVILFHLFGGKLLRFSDLERSIPAISQKMLIQQLRQMENDGIVRRIVHHQVPPKVEYGLTEWGQALCPALDALLQWAALGGRPRLREC
jgi:DNA-binding HxlR family transcriptional regulator